MKPALLIVMIGLVVAATGFVGYNSIHAPHQSQGRLIQTQHAEEQTNQAMQAEVSSLLDQVERYRKRLPPKRDPAWLVTEVLPIADRHGLQFTTITREAPNDIGEMTRLSINLQGTGTYHQIGEFIDELERSEPYLRVERLLMSPPTDASTNMASVNIVVSTVYMPPVVNQPR